jgi:4-hydroxy-tetrahydrodipicolinate reductase
MARKHYRVAQWGTGNVGMRALRAVIEHPLFELVGVKVYADAKIGRDAGELCGAARTGVIATRNIEDIIAAKPDCVIYMPDRAEMDMLCRLLEAGINIATSRMEFNGRDKIEPEVRRKLESACARGKASLYATGSTPGLFIENIPFALSALLRRLDCLTLTDFADMSSRNSPEMLFEILRFGSDPASLDSKAPFGTAISTPPSLTMMAAAMGLPLDDIVTGREFAVTRHRTRIAAGVIEAGTIGAMRMDIAGMRNGQTVIRRRSVWYVTKDVAPAWDLRPTGLHYRVEGDTPLDVMLTFPVSEEEYPKISPGFTAHPVVNAVPYVCEAAPGIRQTDELPPVIGYFGS